MSEQTVEFIVNISALVAFGGLIMRSVMKVDRRIDEIEDQIDCLQCIRERQRTDDPEASFKLDRGKN